LYSSFHSWWVRVARGLSAAPLLGCNWNKRRVLIPARLEIKVTAAGTACRAGNSGSFGTLAAIRRLRGTTAIGAKK
jgi:hypothetical protein